MAQRSKVDTLLKAQFGRKQIVKNQGIHEQTSQCIKKSPKRFYNDYNQYKDQMKKKQYERQSQPCHERRYLEGINSFNVQSLPPSPKHNFSSQMMKILIEQNNNLKEQNKYLQAKLKSISSKEGELMETILEYETIMAALNAQNQQLQKEVLYFSERANSKVDKLGKKLGKLLTKKQYSRSRQDNHHIEQSQSNADLREKYSEYLQVPNVNPFKRIKSQERMLDNRYFISDQEPAECNQQVNNQFQSLLSACRMQANPDKRKQLRRRLVQLTYKKNPIGP